MYSEKEEKEGEKIVLINARLSRETFLVGTHRLSRAQKDIAFLPPPPTLPPAARAALDENPSLCFSSTTTPVSSITWTTKAGGGNSTAEMDDTCAFKRS